MAIKNEGTEITSQTSERRLIYIFFFFLIAFLFFAICNDWIYDESTSYNGVLNNTFWELITYSKFKLANSHAINSVYFRMLQYGNLTNVVYYRLLSLVGFTLFFIANTRILKLLKINSLYIIFLTVAPYFFYFSYGRGYALAIGSFAMAFYYLLKYSREQLVKYEYLIVLFGALSCLSIFSFLYGFLSLLIVFGIFKLKHLKSSHTFILGAIVLGVLLYVYTMGKIVNANDPSIIGVNNFNLLKYGTISSIFSDFSYRDYFVNLFFNHAGVIRIIGLFKLLIMLCVIVPFLYVRRSGLKNIDPINIKTILSLLIILPFLLMIAAHNFAHALYPLTRAVFYLHYVLLLFILVSTISYSKKLIFYAPLIIIGITSLAYISYVYYDLSRPNIKDALVTTKNYPLYVLFENDKTVKLINNLDGINKPNITEGHSTPNIIPLVQKDSSAIRYIICWPAYRDSCLNEFKNAKAYKYRDGYSLIEIRK
jgi:hypothetical protein